MFMLLSVVDQIIQTVTTKIEVIDGVEENGEHNDGTNSGRIGNTEPTTTFESTVAKIEDNCKECCGSQQKPELQQVVVLEGFSSVCQGHGTETTTANVNPPDVKNNSGEQQEAFIEELVRDHISVHEFNWTDLVEAEERNQREKEEGKEETSTTKELSTIKTTEEAESEMLQQHHQNGSHDGPQTYVGRGSIGSTGTTTGGRQHPVNSICTCLRCTETLNDLHSSRGYKNAESPHSTHSEGSADSGRATGPLTSYSPFADATAELGQIADILPIYEFEVPNTLVGLIIGVKGKTIKELCTRADVRMLIRPHHTQGKYETHQICSVEGRRENINKCLHMIRLRFPPCRFADLNLKPVLPPQPTTTTTTTTTATGGSTVRGAPLALTLPVGVPCEVFVSANTDAGHFFVQQPTHPSFSSLSLLDQYMLSVYTQPGGAPDLPKPCNVGVLCAAPAYDGWFRAITLAYDQDQDEMLVRYVDYGGFARVPRADLRQIRTDFMNLPLQGIECYLANVQPADGLIWSEKANELFQQLCMSKIIQAEVVGYWKNDGVPCLELSVLDSNKKTARVDQIMLERGLAKPMDPTLMVRTPLVG
ncbi:hypothetical protein GPALN_006519 [Globodera pallida]|nr:hypothetical protein GPALN_006519 [Globodera pallida]